MRHLTTEGAFRSQFCFLALKLPSFYVFIFVVCRSISRSSEGEDGHLWRLSDCCVVWPTHARLKQCRGGGPAMMSGGGFLHRLLGGLMSRFSLLPPPSLTTAAPPPVAHAHRCASALRPYALLLRRFRAPSVGLSACCHRAGRESKCGASTRTTGIRGGSVAARRTPTAGPGFAAWGHLAPSVDGAAAGRSHQGQGRVLAAVPLCIRVPVGGSGSGATTSPRIW